MPKHAWGKSRSLYCDGKIQVDLIRGWQGGASSLHRHNFKHNQFVVLKGEIYLSDIDGERTHVLSHEDGLESTATIDAGEWHRMEFGQHTTAIEIYYAPKELSILDPVAGMYSDIERKDTGVTPENQPSRHPHNLWPFFS